MREVVLFDPAWVGASSGMSHAMCPCDIMQWTIAPCQIVTSAQHGTLRISTGQHLHHALCPVTLGGAIEG